MRIVYRFAEYLQYVAAGALLVLMMLQVANMVGRMFFNTPLQGTTDLGSYMLLVVVSLGLGWAALEGRHIKVGLVVDKLPAKTRFISDTIILMMILGVVVYMAYINIWAAATWPPRYSSVLKLPYAPFRYIFGVGFAVLGMCTLVVIIEKIRGGIRGEHES